MFLVFRLDNFFLPDNNSTMSNLVEFARQAIWQAVNQTDPHDWFGTKLPPAWPSPCKKSFGLDGSTCILWRLVIWMCRKYRRWTRLEALLPAQALCTNGETYIRRARLGRLSCTPLAKHRCSSRQQMARRSHPSKLNYSKSMYPITHTLRHWLRRRARGGKKEETCIHFANRRG